MSRRAPYLAVTILLALLTLIYAAPMFVQGRGALEWPHLDEFIATDNAVRPLARSMLFAIVTTTLAVLVGFFGAAVFHATGYRSRSVLSLLFIPLLGSVVVGLAFHLDLQYRMAYELMLERDVVVTWSLLVAAQLWQYAPLFFVLFAMQLEAVPQDRRFFAKVAATSFGERVRDFDWPECRNLAMLLSLLGAAEGLRELVKPRMIIGASVGTDTEVMSGWLERSYRMWSKVDLAAATADTFRRAVVIAFVGAILAGVIVTVTSLIVTGLTSVLARAGEPPRAVQWLVHPAVILSCNLAPLFGVATRLRVDALGRLPWRILVSSVLVTLGAIAVAVSLAVLFAIAARVTFAERLSRFDGKSLPLFMLLFGLRLIPPIAFVLCGYAWLFSMDVLTPAVSIAIWIVAQAVVTFPLLAAFSQFAHFNVQPDELMFHITARATPCEVARDSFLTRFTREYLLVTVFGFSVIFGEDSINSMMAFAVPSVAHELALRVGGRTASFHEAAMMVLLMALPVLVAMGLLASLRARYERKAAS